KIMIIGGGPNRIGQGIEFDYTCVHAAFTLRDLGYESIMVNCNPETVSTDYDTSDKLYFEPITVEDVLSIYEKEKPEGVIVQFGGQTPLNIAAELEAAGVKILGSSVKSIDLAEDRELFADIIRKLDIPMPDPGTATTLEGALDAAGRIGYPVMVRPSYVLGGRGMEIVYDDEMLTKYVKGAIEITPEKPMLIDKFLEDALECEVDAISDGTDVFVPSIMEHIEQAGIHSGDSACVLPPVGISEEQMNTLNEYTRRIAIELKVVGLMNIQYAIKDEKVYIIEANPRASRTVPLVSKVTGVSMARIATEVIMGGKLKDMDTHQRKYPHFGVKETTFPFNMFPEVDPVLGPEMRSTGEVLGMADSFEAAFFKSQVGAGSSPPLEGTALITVAKDDRTRALGVAQELLSLGFKIVSTQGTAAFFNERGVECESIKKLHEGRPNIVDAMHNGEIQLVLNTPVGKKGAYDDSYIRKSAIKYNIPYYTTTAAGLAAAKGIRAAKEGRIGIKSVQEYHRDVV
ncbi:MAG TPA: carbamoyl-phosphate synthase large subunit, partial [Methanosarcinaceae archaeon]|nr:carbamoyl-phosphate synthase large subunit [Methanosarcinaceae archaeon]